MYYFVDDMDDTLAFQETEKESVKELMENKERKKILWYRL